MKNRNLGFIARAVTLTVLLTLAGSFAFAADRAPLTPEYAAKKENYRKQKAQQITPEKRKAAAEALKAERRRVYNAKQAKYGSHGKGGPQDGQPVPKTKPEKTDNK